MLRLSYLCVSIRILKITRLIEIEKYLETYSLEEILELNELTEAEMLEFLVNEDFLKLPDPKPCDLNA